MNVTTGHYYLLIMMVVATLYILNNRRFSTGFIRSLEMEIVLVKFGGRVLNMTASNQWWDINFTPKGERL